MEIGRVVAFTGHRPDQLFGTFQFNNDQVKILAKELMKIIEHAILKANATHFITGGALGSDQIAFMCVDRLKNKYPHIQNIMAIPFKEQAIKWKEKDVERYEKMKEKADEVVYVDELPAYMKDKKTKAGKYSGYKMQVRNEYMVDQSHILIAIYNGSESGTKNCVEYAKQQKKKILVLNPNKEFKMDQSLIA